MADDIDRAQAREAELRDDALYAHARRAARRQSAASAWECAACGNPIPPARGQAVPGVQW